MTFILPPSPDPLPHSLTPCDATASLPTAPPSPTSSHPTPITCTDLYRLLRTSFLTTLVIDVQPTTRNFPQLVGSMYKRTLIGPFSDDLASKIAVDDRLACADRIVFYDHAGSSDGLAAHLAALLNAKLNKCTYLHSGMALFASTYPFLVELFNDLSVPKQIADLRDQQHNLIQAVWYSHRSQTYDVPHVIVPDYLYLGGQDAAHPFHLSRFGITHVIRIGFFTPDNLAPNVEYATYTLEDTDKEPIESIWDECCKLILAAKALSVTRIDHTGVKYTGTGRVLVHCHAGVSRSTTVVLVYLMRYLNMTLASAFDFCFKARPIIRPNEGFGRKLQAEECAIFNRAQSSLPLCWMSFDYGWYREYLEFLIRVGDKDNHLTPSPLLEPSASTKMSDPVLLDSSSGPMDLSSPAQSIAPAATDE